MMPSSRTWRLILGKIAAVLFVYALFTWLVVYPLMHDGMFLDGVFYAAIARNLALSRGTWWNLHYSMGVFDQFHQQLPLMIWLQSFFFRLDNTSIYPERIYCLLSGLIMLVLVGYFWKKFTRNDIGENYSWFPQLLMLTVPTISWGLRNNVIENTMVIFDFLSVMFIISFLEKKKSWGNLFAAIIFLLAASLTKGIQGLFPLAVPFAYWLCTRRISFGKMMVTSVSVVTSVFLFYILLITNPVIRKSLLDFFASRLSGFPKTPNANTPNRFWIFFRLLIELSIPASICLLLIFVSYKKFLNHVSSTSLRMSLFFFCTGVSASFPLMISFEQRGFYLITSIPYFIFSFSILAVPSLNSFINKTLLNRKFITALASAAVLFFISGIIQTIRTAGAITRDQELIHDAAILRSLSSAEETVCCTSQLGMDWTANAYLMRYANISLIPNCNSRKYFFTLKNEGSPDTNRYHHLNLQTEFLEVYEKDLIPTDQKR